MLTGVVSYTKRRWLPALIGTSVLASVSFLVYGLIDHWGSSQWGSYGQCVGSAFTLAAVVTALREASRGRRESLKAQRSRLIDHELTRRRENLDALGDLWAALLAVNSPALNFHAYFGGVPSRYNPHTAVPVRHVMDPPKVKQLLLEEIYAEYEKFVAILVETVEPPLFVALAMLKGTPLYEPLRDLNQMFTNYKSVEMAALVAQPGFTPDTKSVREAWKAILAVRQQHLDLAQEHFSLNLADVEAALPESPTPRA